MAICNENKGFGKCYSQLWKCEKCGKIGCTRDGCRNQQFKNGRCMSCGHVRKKTV